MVKQLLVLGLGFDQMPGLCKAKSMGFKLIGLDYDISSPGISLVDQFYQVSIKHWDQVEAWLLSQKVGKIDGVIAFGVDIPLIIARVSDFFGVNYTIPHNSAAISEDKFKAKKLLQSLSIPVPSFSNIYDLSSLRLFAKHYGYPIVVKPVDNSASRGIRLVKNDLELESAYFYSIQFSKKKEVIAEKFLTGCQISSESFIIDGEVYHIGFADRNYYNNDRFYPNIIENGGDIPSVKMTKNMIILLTDYWKKLSKNLLIKNGIIKGDLIVHEGQLIVIEFALRMSGGHFSSLEIPVSTGVDFLKTAIDLHVNNSVNLDDLIPTEVKHLSLRYLFTEDVPNFSGKLLKELKFTEVDASYVLASHVYIKPGEVIPLNTEDHSMRLAYVLVHGKNRENAKNLAKRFFKKIELIV